MPPQRKFKAQVTRVLIHDERVRSYFLKPSIPVPSFKSGQFLQLALDNYDSSSGWPDSRAFSIASGRNESELRIIVSRKGEFTARMFNTINMGSEVWIRMPFGMFNLDSPTDSIVLIAGGTGVSRFIPLLQSITENRSGNLSVKLFYGVRHPRLIIIEELLEACLRRSESFTYRIYCEEGLEIESDYMEGGILPVDEIIENAQANVTPHYYLSGPGGMIKAFRKVIENFGHSLERVYFDEWE